MKNDENPNEKIFEQQKKEREAYLKEIAQMREAARTKGENPKEAVSRLYEGKKVISEGNFEKKGAKEAGVTSGYVAAKKSDRADDKSQQQKYMLKKGAKEQSDEMIYAQENSERQDLITEFVAGGLFKRFLYDRAPEISLVNNDNEIQTLKTKSGKNLKVEVFKQSADHPNIAITSKFFNDFQTLSEYSGNTNKYNNPIKNRDPNHYKNINGFEKVIAASIVLGETDYHGGNIGLTKKGENYEAVKIDHGRSLVQTKAENGYDMLAQLEYGLRGRQYLNADGTALISFNVDKFKESLEQMTKVSNDEINNLVENKLHLLKQNGVKMEHSVGVIGEKFTEILQHNIKIAKETLEIVGIVSKVNAPDKVKNGDWLHSVTNKDPIAWAFENNYTIGKDKKDPINWAVENNLKIEGKEPIKYRDEMVKARNDMIAKTTSALIAKIANATTLGDITDQMRMEYKNLLAKINPDTQPVGINSELGKFLSDGNPKQVASKIRSLSRAASKGGHEAITGQQFLYGCDLDLMVKITEINKEITPETGRFGAAGLKFSKIINKIGDFFNNIDPEKAKNVAKDLEKIKKAPKLDRDLGLVSSTIEGHAANFAKRATKAQNTGHSR